MQPLKAKLPHPVRRAHGHTGHKVEGAADAERYGDRQFGAVAIDPEVLLGVAIGDKQNVGLRALQPAGD